MSKLTCRPKLRGNSGEWDTTLYDKNHNLSLLFRIQIFTLNFLQQFMGLQKLVRRL